MEYRIEKKYIVSDMQIAALKNRLSLFMHTDQNQQKDAYRIRSLYFDDYRDSCFQDNEDGVNEREKFRIRIYNGSRTLIKLEEKSKYLTFTKKQAVSISEEECRLYQEGKIPALKVDAPFLIKKLYAKMQSIYLRPVIIVEYERSAFVDELGNTRITFDRNICGSRQKEDFLKKEISMIPIFSPGEHIMEVKYDEFLPDYIEKILMSESLRRVSFSKYYYARNNEMLC